MQLKNPDADVYVPDGSTVAEALVKTTHLAVGAHQDDIEFMALHGVLECFRQADRWFSGVTVTDGGGCPRGGPYEKFSDEQMRKIRTTEQRKPGKWTRPRYGPRRRIRDGARPHGRLRRGRRWRMRLPELWTLGTP